MTSRVEAGISQTAESPVISETELINQELSQIRTEAVDLLSAHSVKQLRGPINLLYAGSDINDYLYPFGDQYSVKGITDEENNIAVAVVAFTYRRNLENVDIIELQEDGNADTLILRKKGGYIVHKRAGTKDDIRKRPVSLPDIRAWREKLTQLKELEQLAPEEESPYSPQPAVQFDEIGARII